MLEFERFVLQSFVVSEWVMARIYRQFVCATRGVAAIEFALILPALVVMFLASIDAGRAIAIYMKVRSATYTVAAITNQYETIQSSDMTSIFGATSLVLAPYSTTPAAITVSQIKVSSATKAKVNWSDTLNGTALKKNASVMVPGNFASCASYPCYLIYGQVTYKYTPLFGLFAPSTITLSDDLYVTPRVSECILYPPQNIKKSPC
jgi:Flp pilus assembly protein TadG